MFKARVRKLLSDLTLSITYSRLLEEIDDTKNKNKSINEGIFTRFQNKQLEKNDIFIAKVNEAINNIKSNYSTSEYNIIEDNKLDNKLIALSKKRNFVALKYALAISVVLDNTVEYKNTNDYLAKISVKLFNNESTIKRINDKLTKVYGYLTKEEKEDVTDSIIDGAIVTLPIIKYLKTPAKAVLVGATRHPFVAAGALAVGASLFGYNGHISKIRNNKKIKNLDATDLEYILMTKAVCIELSKTNMDSSEYINYIKGEMKIINSIKKKVNKELFNKLENIDENIKKVKLLSNFDKYLLNEIKFINFN